MLHYNRPKGGRIRSPLAGHFLLVPQVGDEKDLESAIAVSQTENGFDLQRFATDGISRIHPLWLIMGLSNNILGYGSVSEFSRC